MTETFGGRSGLFTLLPDADPTATGIEVALRRVSTNYFAAMGIPVQQGRAFGPQALDTEVILDEFAASYLVPAGRDAVGARVRQSRTAPPLTVVGIVAAIRDSGPFQRPTPHAYLPLAGDDGPLEVIVRVDRPSPELGETLGSVIAGVTGARPPAIRSADVALSALTAGPRFNATLMGIFGAVALLIGGGAAYAVASLSAIQRRRELAVRAALGASRRQLVLPVVRQAVRCLAVGLLIGLPAGWAIASVFDAHLFLVTSGDVEIYGAVAVVMLGSTVAAVAGPAWRAARANPATELSRE